MGGAGRDLQVGSVVAQCGHDRPELVRLARPETLRGLREAFGDVWGPGLNGSLQHCR